MRDSCKHEIFQAVALVSLASHFHVLDQLVVDLFQYCASLELMQIGLDFKIQILKNICVIMVLDGWSDMFCITIHLILINT